jgi:hypothetical protein
MFFILVFSHERKNQRKSPPHRIFLQSGQPLPQLLRSPRSCGRRSFVPNPTASLCHDKLPSLIFARLGIAQASLALPSLFRKNSLMR